MAEKDVPEVGMMPPPHQRMNIDSGEATILFKNRFDTVMGFDSLSEFEDSVAGLNFLIKYMLRSLGVEIINGAEDNLLRLLYAEQISSEKFLELVRKHVRSRIKDVQCIVVDPFIFTKAVDLMVKLLNFRISLRQLWREERTQVTSRAL